MFRNCFNWNSQIIRIIAIYLLLPCGWIWSGVDLPQTSLPATTPPLTYYINYTSDYFTKPDFIDTFKEAPPDLLHVGKAVPITHHWGPIRLYQGENQYTGGPGHTLSRENIALLTPAELEQRIQTIRQMTQRYHRIGIPEIVPYISYHTLAGDHQKRLGFWSFYDKWPTYETWAGPRLQRDPFDWLVVDTQGKFVGGSCGGYSPAYYSPLHRYRACINHPDWAEWQRRLIGLIASVGYDGCFIDNADSDACYCRFCKKEFREFITKSNDTPWILRMTRDLSPESITLDNPEVPEELIQRWRWLRTRDHLGMLRETGRKIHPGFTIFPNHSQLENALIVGEKCDRLMFESTFSPGIYLSAPQDTEVLTIAVNSEASSVKTIMYSYQVYDPITWMEMEAEISLPDTIRLGETACIEAKILSIGASLQDNDAAEDFHLILQERGSKTKIRVAFQSSGPVGGSGSSRRPRQPPVTLQAKWTPEKEGQYEVFLGFRYSEDSHDRKTYLQPRCDKLVWERFCRNHVAELLFTQHMAARTIYLGYEARGKGWVNVQELALAEMAAFSGGGGFSGRGSPQAKYRKFFKQYSHLFEGWRLHAPTAILYSAWSGNPLSVRNPVSTRTIHDSLMRTGRLFTTLVDITLTDNPEALSGFHVIYMPARRYELRSDQIGALQEYVRRGGQIVRGNNPIQINGQDAENIFPVSVEEPFKNQRKGSVRIWEQTHPWLPTEPILTTQGLSRNLRFALYQKENQLCLHVVNYNVCLLRENKEILDIESLPLHIPIPKDWISVQVTCFDPDDDTKEIPCKIFDEKAYITLSDVHI